MGLKLVERKIYPYVLAVSCSAVVVLWLKVAPHPVPGGLPSAVGVVAAFVYFLYKQNLDEAKFFKQLFTEFNARYSDLDAALYRIIESSADAPLSPDEKMSLYKYFNLCAEERFFYGAGFVDEKVWQSWSHGMKIFFKNPRIKDLWEHESKTDSYYGFRPPL
ncbi:MAG TPA: hypothetical protein VMU53_03945 [Candidatus Sulfotelmatobacter sp.]|nr:hypothetical protein [Candidatus Sulfotelmatobacter sp.]